MEKIDALNREAFVGNLIKIIYGLTKTKKTASIAMNGQWGCGKSFVLNMLEEKLSVFHSSQADTDGKYFVFHYNCWQYDYYDEPIMAIVSALQDTIKEYNVLQDAKYADYTEKFYAISRVVLEIGRQIALNKLGIDFGELYEAYQGNNSKEYFDEYIFLTEAVKNLKESLSDIAKDRPILLVVDELDRCLPEYAIKVLERLHHIFYGVENIVVLMAYDENQITHTVEEIFGQGTDVNNYLRKFVDFKLYLENGSNTNNILRKFDSYFNSFGIDDDKEFCDFLNNIFVNKSMREREKSLEKAKLVNVIADIPFKNKYICAAEILYVFFRDVDFNDKDLLWFMRFLTAGVLDVEPLSVRKKIDDEMIKVLNENFNIGKSDFGRPCVYFSNNLIGTAMYYISLVNEKYLRDNGYIVTQMYRNYIKDEREAVKKFAENLMI